MPEDQAIETHDLSKNYGDRLAVDRLNLTVASRQVHGFLGPNGAGKSTTIKMMVGLLRPTSGTLSILGKNVRGDNPKVRRDLGYMPELPRFPKHLSGEELLDVYGRMYGMSKTERKARIPDLIKMVGLEGRGKDRIGKYSKGMQQRIGIAQALISSPELVILDEPSIGLDPVGMVEVRNMVKDIVKSGTTVFFSSHLLAEVQQVCDHVTVIHLGVMRYTGTLEDIANKVTARRRLVIELDKPVDSVLAALKSLNKGSVEANMNTYTIHLDTREDARAEVSRAVANAGGLVVSMREEGGGLEDAFLSLVGKDGLA